MSALALQLIQKAKQTRATRLDLGNCGLTELPDELFELTWLEELILSSGWGEYDFEKNEEKWVQSQNKGDVNNIKAFNPKLKILRGVKKLIANNQKELSDLSLLKDLANLQQLDVFSTQVSDLSPLKDLRQLQYLDINNTQVSDLSTISNISKLEILYAGGTKIQNIESICNFYYLIGFSCWKTKIIDLSPLSALKNLKKIWIWDTKLSDLSPLKDLTQLQHLDVSSTQVSDLSPLKDLTQLQQLHVQSTQVGDLSPLKDLTQLQHLDVSSTQVSELTPLKDLTQLQLLHVHSTQVGELTPLKDLVNLQELSVFSTQVSNLMPLKDLIKLRTLFIAIITINDLSPLKDLTQLQTLYISSTQVSDLSPLKDFVHLQNLFLSGTQVSDLSPLKDLTQLQQLDVSSTHVSDLTPLRDLKNLTLCDIRFTPIRDIKPLMEQINEKMPIKWEKNSEEGLFVKNTKIGRNLIAAVKSGENANKAVLDYINRKKEKIYEARVLIMGEPRAGKTTLKLKLKSPSADMPTEEESTKGIDIDIEKYTCPIHEYNDREKQPKLQYNVWDFGGQEMYKILHQLFVAEDSAYIIVTNTDRNKNEEEIEFWLETIEKLGKSREEDGGYGPVILFQNAKTDRAEYNSFKALKDRFPFWKQNEDFVINLNKISNKTEEDKKRFDKNELEKFKKFKKYLEKRLQTLPQVGEEIPVEWAKIRRKLAKLIERDYIPIEEFRAICTANKITDALEQMRLSKMLHILGVVLHYQDSTAEILRGMVILNRKWATDALYRVLDSKIVTDNSGWFFKDDAKNIWYEDKYQDKIGELLALMEEFKMCYLNANSKRYIVPTKLPFDPPENPTWNEVENVKLHLQYDWLPRPIVTQLIVSLHEHIANSQNWIWRRGAVISGDKLDAKEALARIIDNIKENKIEINAKGNLSEYLIKSILDKWREINETYEGKVEVSRIILCNCEKCQKEKKPFEFDYEDVLSARAANEKLKCNRSRKDMEVTEILRGIFDDKTLNQDLKQKFPQIYHSEMKIENFNNYGGQVNMADRIDNIEYNAQLGISQADFEALQKQIKALSHVKQEELKNIVAIEATTEVEKTNIGKRALAWLNQNAEGIAANVAASVYYDGLKYLFGLS